MNNLVLITSIINTPNTPLSYSNVRSVFTRKERYTQTKKTIQSIKEKIPNYKIMIVECTNFTEEEKSYFENECDYVLNLWDKKELHYNIFGVWKSMGEGTMTIEAFKYIFEKKIDFNNLFKISGRYWLGDKFKYKNFINDKMVFKHNENGIITTTLYKIPKIYITELYNLLYKILITDNNKEIMYEKIFTLFADQYIINRCGDNSIINFVNMIGINGFCTTKGAPFSF